MRLDCYTQQELETLKRAADWQFYKAELTKSEKQYVINEKVKEMVHQWCRPLLPELVNK